MATKKKEDIIEEKAFDVTPFNPITAGLAELDKTYADLYAMSPEELDKFVALTDGVKVVKDAKKEHSGIRTKITAAHKAAKQPYLDAGRAIDGMKKDLEKQIKDREQPFTDALQRLKDKEAAETKKAQDAKIAALEAQLAEANAALEANEIVDVKFEEKTVDITLTSKNQLVALEKIIGKDNVQALKFDEEGTPYTLGLLVRRKEIQL